MRQHLRKSSIKIKGYTNQGSTLRKYFKSPVGLVTKTLNSPELFLLAPKIRDGDRGPVYM